MIVYDLLCDNEHKFESWFKNSAAYEFLRKGRKVSCPICSSTKVRKAPMAPNISKLGGKDKPSRPQSEKKEMNLSNDSQDGEMKVAVEKAVGAMKELQATIEKNFENVGEKFPEEARKIHYGETDSRGIYGEATVEQAEELIEEGVEIATIPWVKRRTS